MNVGTFSCASISIMIHLGYFAVVLLFIKIEINNKQIIKTIKTLSPLSSQLNSSPDRLSDFVRPFPPPHILLNIGTFTKVQCKDCPFFPLKNCVMIGMVTNYFWKHLFVGCIIIQKISKINSSEKKAKDFLTN